MPPQLSKATRWASDARARAVVVPYVISRVVVLGALVLTRHVVTALARVRLPLQATEGLFAWDASWYRDIAAHGYGGVAKEGLRFFPLVPMLARAGAWLPGVSVRLCAPARGQRRARSRSASLVYELARGEGRSDAVARRAVWIVYLAPPAFVLVMGYAEATFMTAALVALLALRRRRWWVAAIAGVVAGLTRPVGLLLVVPAAGRGVPVPQAAAPSRARDGRGRGRGARGRHRRLSRVGRAPQRRPPLPVARAAGVVRAAAVGSIPCGRCGDAAHASVSGDHLSAGIHVVTAVVLVVLIVGLWRRWPASFTAYAVVAVAVALSARNLDSLERYSLSTVPLALAAADLVGGGTRERVVLALLGATLVACSVLAFTGVLVP